MSVWRVVLVSEVCFQTTIHTFALPDPGNRLLSFT